MAAFFGVLMLGTIYGVIIGIILSFVEVILRETDPPRCFLGIIPGRDGFYDRAKNRFAYPIDHVVMYQSVSYTHLDVYKRQIWYLVIRKW